MQDVNHLTVENRASAPDTVTYHHCVAKLKHMAGLPGAKMKSIRESIRDDTFPRDLQDAMGCDLLENWPLREQIRFLDGLAGLTDAEKSVKIHEAAYGLYRQRAITQL